MLNNYISHMHYKKGDNYLSHTSTETNLIICYKCQVNTYKYLTNIILSLYLNRREK